MTEADIEKALRTAYLASVTNAATLTAFENVPFDPKGKDIWYSFHYMPNNPEVATLGSSGTDEFTGLAQVDINIKQGIGTTGISAAISALRSAFTPSTRLVYGSANLIIKSCGQDGNGRNVDNHFRTTVSIYFEARLPRS